MNLWLTLLITLGLWPLVAATFGRVSLLVFAGNLLMVPVLSLLVLPLGLAGLAVSALHLGSAPGGLPERAVFAALDAALSGWVWLARTLDALGGALVLAVELAWPPGAYFAYYAVLLTGIALAYAWRAHRQRTRGASAA